MAVKARDQEPESAVEWLENELRETKARLQKVEGELDQALKQFWSLEADVRRVAEAFSVSGPAPAALAALREDVRQLHSQMGKTQDRHSALANRTDEMFRQRQTETGRDRQDLSEVTKQVAGERRAFSTSRTGCSRWRRHRVAWRKPSRAAISPMRRSNARSRTYLYARPGRTRPRFALTKMLVA